MTKYLFKKIIFLLFTMLLTSTCFPFKKTYGPISPCHEPSSHPKGDCFTAYGRGHCSKTKETMREIALCFHVQNFVSS